MKAGWTIVTHPAHIGADANIRTTDNHSIRRRSIMMKQLTILTIVAASLALIVPPAHAGDKVTDLQGFIAGVAHISTTGDNFLDISAAVGIPATFDGRAICQAPPTATPLNEAVEAFEAAAASNGYRTTRLITDGFTYTVAFDRTAKHNGIVR